MTRQLDITLRAGETLAFDIESITDERGQPVTDASGWSARMKVRTRPEVDAIIDIVAVPNTPPTSLHFETGTGTIPPNTYGYDVRLTSPDGFVSYPFAGTLKIVAPFTDA